MKLTIYQSDKGDCLLLTSSDERHMLVDGGMASSFRDHTAQHLSDLKHLDRVCVTHIDQDHISGIIEMCDSMVDWKVFEFQQQQGNNRFKKPKNPKPPTVDAIWHNSFDEQFGENAPAMANSAAFLSSVFSTSKRVSNTEIAETLMGIEQSQRQGFLLAETIGSKMLAIPVNPEVDGKLMISDDDKETVYKLGATTIRLIGPLQADIDKLRSEWETWIGTAKGSAAVEKIKDAVEKDEGRFDSSVADSIMGAMAGARREAEISLGELGLRRNVTTPNLASIMFIAEECDKKILFTGDGHWKDIDRGIELDGKFDPQAGIHFDVIKVPHHGSEHNSRLSFWRRMTADHYVFCSNGGHHNPDLEILEKIIQSRQEDADKGKPHSGKPYKFWFNASSGVTTGNNHEHMKKVEKLVAKAKTQNRLEFIFLSDSSFSISLD